MIDGICSPRQVWRIFANGTTLPMYHLISIPSRIRCEPMINPAPMRANDTKTHVPSASSSSDFLNADRVDLLIRGYRRDILIPLLTFVWRIWTANLIRICHPRRLWNDKRKRRKRNIANPVRTNVAISHPSWYRRTECSALKPEHF